MRPDTGSDGSTDVESESQSLCGEFQPAVRALSAVNFSAGDIATAAGMAGLNMPYDIIGRCQAWRDQDLPAAQMSAAVQLSGRAVAGWWARPLHLPLSMRLPRQHTGPVCLM